MFHGPPESTASLQRWNGGSKLSVLGTLEDIRVVKYLFTPLCCEPLQARFSLFQMTVPAKDLGATIRQPEKLNAELLRRFEAGEGELQRSDTVLALSGVEAQQGEYTLLATVAPDNETINVQFQHRGDQVKQSTFITTAGSPLIVQSQLSGDKLGCLVLLVDLVDRTGKPRLETKGMIPVKKVSVPEMKPVDKGFGAPVPKSPTP